MKCFVLLLTLAVSLPLHAETLGGVVKITPVAGWTRENPGEPGQQASRYPTLRFAPKNGRNAAIILTLLPNDAPGFTVTNHASLERFNLISARPYIANPDDPPAPSVVEINNGIGVSLTNEDPALIGKPVPPNEYRIATSVSVLLDRKYLIHCTIFYDEKDSAELHEGLDILLSATLKGGTSLSSNNNI
jgi:hypothetical protein